RCRLSEEGSIVVSAFIESSYLCIRVHERAAGRVITIRLEILNRTTTRCVGIWSSIELYARECCAMQILRGEVRSEIRTVAKYGTVFHQAIPKEDLLACHYVFTGE